MNYLEEDNMASRFNGVIELFGVTLAEKIDDYCRDNNIDIKDFIRDAVLAKMKLRYVPEHYEQIE